MITLTQAQQAPEGLQVYRDIGMGDVEIAGEFLFYKTYDYGENRGVDLDYIIFEDWEGKLHRVDGDDPYTFEVTQNDIDEDLQPGDEVTLDDGREVYSIASVDYMNGKVTLDDGRELDPVESSVRHKQL